MYKIVITKQALKEISSLSAKTCKEVSSVIDSLAINPRPAGCKKLKGEKEYLWRVRSGNYRIIYLITDSVQVVEIRKVGHRKNVYE